MEKLEQLPVYAVPDDAAGGVSEPRLTVDGLVQSPGQFTRADLKRLTRAAHSGDFVCLHGWVVEGLHWEGTLLGEVLDAAGVKPEAQYVRVSSGDYTLPLPIDQARAALLADRLDGEALALAHGAPWRLMLPEGECFTSVKWIARIEVTDEPGPNTAQEIALARLAPST